MKARGETRGGLQVLAERRVGRRFEQRLGVPSDLRCLEGHFPGFPVLPALAQIGWALEAGSSLAGRPLAPTRIEALKLRELIRPGDVFDARVEVDENGEVLSFETSREGRVASSCRFAIAGRPEDAEDLGVVAPFETVADPVDARELIPHAGPMVFLDSLLAGDETRAICSVRVRDLPLFRDADGSLPAWAAFEPMAQSIAAFGGLGARRLGEAPKVGFLVGCRRLEIRTDRLDPKVGYAAVATRVWGGEKGLVSFECGLFELSSRRRLLAGRINAYLPEDLWAIQKGLS